MFPDLRITFNHIFVIVTKRGRHVCTGRATHVVDIGLAVARTGTHDGGAGRAADPPGGRALGDNTPEGNTIICGS